MDEQRLRELTERRLSIRQIAILEGVSFTTVRYWLKKHGLQTARGSIGIKDISKSRRCHCGENDPMKFYGNKKQCAHCHNQYTKKRGKENRFLAIEYLGSKCLICGYNRFKCSLDVHHMDPLTKDPGWKHMRGWSWQRIERELSQCVLLCKNCHTAVENKELLLPVAQPG